MVSKDNSAKQNDIVQNNFFLCMSYYEFSARNVRILRSISLFTSSGTKAVNKKNNLIAHVAWLSFPSCVEPHYESEAKYKAFHVKISFVCI